MGEAGGWQRLNSWVAYRCGFAKVGNSSFPFRRGRHSTRLLELSNFFAGSGLFYA